MPKNRACGAKNILIKNAKKSFQKLPMEASRNRVIRILDGVGLRITKGHGEERGCKSIHHEKIKKSYAQGKTARKAENFRLFNYKINLFI